MTAPAQSPAGSGKSPGVTVSGAILLSIAISCLSYYLLPNTLFAKWSVLASFSPGISPDHVTPFAAFTAAIATAVLIVWFRMDRGLQFDKHAKQLWVLASVYLGLFAITSIQLSLNKFESEENSPFVVLVGLATGLFSARLCRTPIAALSVVAILGIIQAIMSIYYLRMGVNILWSGNVARIGGTFNQPLHIYVFMAFVLPFILTRIISSRSAHMLCVTCMSFALCMAVMVMTWTRGGMLATAVAMVFVIHAFYTRWRLTLAVFGVSALLCCGVAFWRSNGEVNFSSSYRSNISRIHVWKHALLIFVRHPFSGVGLGATDLPIEMRVVSQTGVTTISTRSADPKNVLLYWATELGIGGVILFCWFAASIAKVLRGFKDDAAIALGGTWLAILITGLTDTPFGLANRPSGNVLVGTLLGATLLYAATKHERVVSGDPPKH